MAKYRYAGPGPIEVVSGGEVTRPGDEREFDEEPTWGPWDLLDEPEAADGDPEPPGPQEASPAALAPGLTAPSLTVPPAKEF
jgi:hypothetical protein